MHLNLIRSMAQQYTSIRLIIDKIMRHPLMADLSLESIVDYTIDFMRIVGSPAIFEDKVTQLEIKEYRAALPCDYYNVTQVKYCGNNGATFRSTTDSFYPSASVDNAVNLTYKIQGNLIYTSIREGVIELAYTAISVDSDGYPLIPDNSSFTRALELYIKKQWFTILFDLGKISQASLQNTQQEYAWSVGDCQSEFTRLSIDEAESFYNSWRSLIVRTSEHTNGFRYSGTPEKLKVH